MASKGIDCNRLPLLAPENHDSVHHSCLCHLGNQLLQPAASILNKFLLLPIEGFHLFFRIKSTLDFLHIHVVTGGIKSAVKFRLINNVSVLALLLGYIQRPVCNSV